MSQQNLSRRNLLVGAASVTFFVPALARETDVNALASGNVHDTLSEFTTPEDHGAMGNGTTDDRAAIQKAIDAAIRAGHGRVRFPSRKYAIRHSTRTPGATDINADYTGHGLVIDGRVTLESVGGRTDLYFQRPDGTAASGFDLIGGAVWRGGGIFVRGAALDPGKLNRNSLTLRGIHLQGGTTRSGDNAFPANTTTGAGWDLTHKGIWAENDRYVGDITLIDSGIHGFRGELWYMAGSANGGMIGRNVEMSQTDATAFNPNQAEFVDVDGFYVHDVFQGWEGVAGARGHLRGVFKDCDRLARLQGGNINGAGAGVYYLAPRRSILTQIPWLVVDIDLINCGIVMVGAFVRGSIRATDTLVYLNRIAAGDNFRDIDIDVHAVADQLSLDAVAFYPVDANTSNIRVRITTGRTQAAIAAGRAIGSPVTGSGVCGAGVEFHGGGGPVLKWPKPIGGGWTGTKPVWRDNDWQLVGGAEAQAETLRAGAAAPAINMLAPSGSHVYLYGGGASTFQIGLATAGYSAGTELTIFCASDGGASFRFTDGVGKLRLRAASYTFSDKRISFRFDGTNWLEMTFGGVA